MGTAARPAVYRGSAWTAQRRRGPATRFTHPCGAFTLLAENAGRNLDGRQLDPHSNRAGEARRCGRHNRVSHGGSLCLAVALYQRAQPGALAVRARCRRRISRPKFSAQTGPLHADALPVRRLAGTHRDCTGGLLRCDRTIGSHRFCLVDC
jgi:hypothetical protein